jgi:uncharacterized protein (DUF2336 family)
MITSLMDELFFNEMLHRHYVELFQCHCRVWKFRAALFAWKQARVYLMRIQTIQATQAMLRSSHTTELNRNNGTPVIC